MLAAHSFSTSSLTDFDSCLSFKPLSYFLSTTQVSALQEQLNQLLQTLRRSPTPATRCAENMPFLSLPPPPPSHSLSHSHSLSLSLSLSLFERGGCEEASRLAFHSIVCDKCATVLTLCFFHLFFCPVSLILSPCSPLTFFMHSYLRIPSFVHFFAGLCLTRRLKSLSLHSMLLINWYPRLSWTRLPRCLSSHLPRCNS